MSKMSTEEETVRYPIGSQAISTAIVLAVSSALDTEPVELPPLYSAIDPEPLNAIWESYGARDQPFDIGLSLTFAGCEVEIDGRDTVIVSPN